MSTRSIGVNLGSLMTFGAVFALLCGASYGQPSSAAAAATGAPSASGRCGGLAGLGCNPNEWCEYDNPGMCGSGDQMGFCQPRPLVCTKDCPGVTGCDGEFYCNACMAHQAGYDVQGFAVVLGSARAD